MPDFVLEATGLHAYYGGSHVIHEVNFSVKLGELVGLMGRNGMGKTTLLRAMLGFIQKRSGFIKVKGRDMSLAAPHAIARNGIAYVPEGRGIFPNLSARENLLMAARPGSGRLRNWMLPDVLDIFPRLAERLDHGGSELSGGEQQMLSIGRALLTNPDMLIMDEATEGLAPLVAQQIWETIVTLKDAGMAIVVVDRNFQALAELSDKVVILEKGRTVFEGSGRELRARPRLHQQYLGI